jgi:methyltransferase (TIGR00027 family)
MASASPTAELMAVMRALESVRPASSRLFVDPFAKHFVSWRWRFVIAISKAEAVRRVVESLYDRVAGPGPRPSAVARTRFIDDVLVEILRDVEQFVILGAGFDCRPYRLPSLEKTRVFEVDRPDTQRNKTDALERILSGLPSRMTFVAVDFERDDLEEKLRGAGFRDDVPAVFLWEGVTNYLTAEAVDATLRAVRAFVGPGSRLVFTYVDSAALGDEAATTFPEARRWIEGVKRRGEPWTFGLDPTEVKAFLDARGFQLQRDLSTAEAGDLYFVPRNRTERGSALYRVAVASVSSSR